MAQGAELFRPNIQSAARGLPRCVSRCLHRALRPNKRRQTYSAQMLAINLPYKHLPLQGFGTTAPQQPFDNDRLHQSCTDNDTNSATLVQQASKLASFDPTLANEKECKLTLVEQIVKRLPSPCKELLWGFYRDGMSMKALAHMHHYSEGAVKVIKHRCCEKFKKQYETTINQTR